MKTTVIISDAIYKKAKSFGLQSNKTMSQMVEEGLRLVVKGKTSTQRKKTLPDASVTGSGFTEEFLHSSWAEKRSVIYGNGK